LTFSPDGALLASVALSDGDQVDHSAKIWRTSDGALLRTLPDVGEQTTQRLAFSPDGAMVVVGEADHRAHLVRIADGVEVASVGSTTSGWSVLGVAMSPDGTLITANCRCSSPAFHAVRLWRLDGTEDLGVGDLGQIASGFAFSPDGAALAVAVAASPTDATTIKILRLSDRSQVWQANLTSSSPVAGVSLAFSPDGSTIAAAPLFGDNVTVFRASDGQVLRAALFASAGSSRTIGQIGFSGDGSLLGVATYAGLHMFHTTDWSVAGALGQSNTFIAAALSPTASRAAAAGQNGVIYQWCNLGQ
jgi:WD40 repeat protein